MTKFVEGQKVKYIQQLNGTKSDVPINSIGRYIGPVNELAMNLGYTIEAEFYVETDNFKGTFTDSFIDGELEAVSE
jgi:hypothetical protein